MEIIHWRLLFDFGLTVLIWLVQLVVYPGFEFYSTHHLSAWHKQYTSRITWIVFPLMTGQLGLLLYQLVNEPSLYSLASGAMIAVVWMITFLYFIPAHRRISKGETGKYLKDMIRINWWRTLLWTFVLLVSLLEVLTFTQ